MAGSHDEVVQVADAAVGPAFGQADDLTTAASDDGERSFGREVGAEDVHSVRVPLPVREGFAFGVAVLTDAQLELDAAAAHHAGAGEGGVGDRSPDAAVGCLGLLEQVHTL